MNQTGKRILLVEDNVDHAMLIQMALASRQLEVVHLPTAELAQDYLAVDRNLAIVLVDINLPGASGIDFLRWFKAQALHQMIPVVMLSTSDNPTDVRESFRAGAGGYFIKPEGLQLLKEKLEVVLTYWLQTSLLPAVENSFD